MKQALVKALSQNGVGQDELDHIRKDLGLAADDAAEAFLRQIRAADSLKLPRTAVNYIKIALIGVKNHAAIDLAALEKEAAKISIGELEKRLAQNAPKGDIYSVLKEIALQIAETAERVLQGREGVGDDEQGAVVDILANAVIRSKPALFESFNAFVSREDVKTEYEDNMFNGDNDVTAIKVFNCCVNDTDINMAADVNNARVHDLFGAAE